MVARRREVGRIRFNAALDGLFQGINIDGGVGSLGGDEDLEADRAVVRWNEGDADVGGEFTGLGSVGQNEFEKSFGFVFEFRGGSQAERSQFLLDSIVRVDWGAFTVGVFAVVARSANRLVVVVASLSVGIDAVDWALRAAFTFTFDPSFLRAVWLGAVGVQATIFWEAGRAAASIDSDEFLAGRAFSNGRAFDVVAGRSLDANWAATVLDEFTVFAFRSLSAENEVAGDDRFAVFAAAVADLELEVRWASLSEFRARDQSAVDFDAFRTAFAFQVLPDAVGVGSGIRAGSRVANIVVTVWTAFVLVETNNSISTIKRFAVLADIVFDLLSSGGRAHIGGVREARRIVALASWAAVGVSLGSEHAVSFAFDGWARLFSTSLCFPGAFLWWHVWVLYGPSHADLSRSGAIRTSVDGWRSAADALLAFDWFGDEWFWS